jgi:DNA-binding MarR family transcriptional regulator
VNPATDWLDDRQQRSWRRFLAVQQRLLPRLGQHLQRDSGLSPADYQILVNLSESPHGRMRAFEIGRATQWEKSRLSHHLTRMAQRGLVERRMCADDTRYADIVLTEAGRAAIEQASALHVPHVRHYFLDALTEEQLTALDGICDAILARLDEDGDQDPALGECTAEDKGC